MSQKKQSTLAAKRTVNMIKNIKSVEIWYWYIRAQSAIDMEYSCSNIIESRLFRDVGSVLYDKDNCEW